MTEPQRKISSAARLLPGGVPSLLPEEIRVARGSGGQLWDDQGRCYVDLAMGYGAVSLGHAHVRVISAVCRQLTLGQVFPIHSQVEHELTSRLGQLFPGSVPCFLLKTGSEAVAAAVRLARAFAGRQKVIRCGFHGWHDPFMAQHRSWHRFDVPTGPCVHPPGISELQVDTIEWLGDSTESLCSLVESMKGDLACLILDPIQLREPIGENLKQIIDIVHRAGALVVLDEVKTGFRVSLTGIQGMYGVDGDITVLSKGIANGFPLAAVVVRADIAELRRDVKVMGTYNGELSAMVAALETIAVMMESDVVTRLQHLGQRFIDGANEAFRRTGWAHSAEAVPYRWPCMPYIRFLGSSPAVDSFSRQFYTELSKRRVLMLANHPNFVCAEHSDAQMDDAARAIEDVCMSLVPEGSDR